ncbi:MAG TPA: cohesin domain-containing protein [candidate division Zixibacteria bacterium]|nr:cohesin domain-containing protein [candidate division Zixibacteria bacterium]
MRSVLFSSPNLVRLFSALAVLCGLLLLLPHTAGATSITLDNVTEVPLGSTVILSLSVGDVDQGHILSGFDLLIAFDNTFSQLDDVQPGELLTNCGWEYFSYRSDISGQVRIVALAETNNGDVHPSCLIDGTGVLAELNFAVSTNPDYRCYLLPVRFYWNDCGDNVFSSESGDSLYISDRIYDFGNDITGNEAFPTYAGANNDCLIPDNIFRGIDFYNGSIELSCDSTTTGNPRISLDQRAGTTMGEIMPISIRLSDLDEIEAGGFDFLIGYDPEIITAVDATPGELLSACDWEYFNYTVSDLPECDGTECPEAAIRIVAVADINDGPNHPSCYAADSGQLASINFATIVNQEHIGIWYPLSFVWLDCSDNVLSSVSGDSLFLSRNVYDVGGLPILADDVFPTISGAPDECLSEGMALRRAVDFYGGRYNLIPPEIDDRGDLNLNGIANELADYQIYVLYFIYGLSAFQIDVEHQVAASDINADGITLSLSDLFYLYRIIVGDTQVNPVKDIRAVDTVILIQDTVANTVSLQSSGNISALYFMFDSDVMTVTTELEAYQVTYGPDSSDTRALFMPTFENFTGLQPLPAGELMSYTAPGNITYATGTWDGTASVQVLIEKIGEGGCCLVRGNIDHSTDGSINISDLIYLVQWAFGGGPEPPCMDEADVDAAGDGTTISDVVYLVNYMFMNGPEPAGCE